MTRRFKCGRVWQTGCGKLLKVYINLSENDCEVKYCIRLEYTFSRSIMSAIYSYQFVDREIGKKDDENLSFIITIVFTDQMFFTYYIF